MRVTAAHAPTRPTETRFSEIVFPQLANHYGTLFGGTALSLMGKAAFLGATRFAGGKIVMAQASNVEFLHPVQVGELIELVARIERTGHSSMTVSVNLIAEDVTTRPPRIAATGSFEMVAVDDAGRPTRLKNELEKTLEEEFVS